MTVVGASGRAGRHGRAGASTTGGRLCRSVRFTKGQHDERVVSPVAESAGAVDVRAVDTVRLLAADVVQKVGNGHPGTAMSLAPMADAQR